jgi:hypothetical protein
MAELPRLTGANNVAVGDSADGGATYTAAGVVGLPQPEGSG